MNIILLFLEIIFSSIALIFLIKKYKYEGIYLWLFVFSMILGIISQKSIELFGLEINLGFVINSLIFIAANIIVQKKGPKEIIKILSTIILGSLTIYSFLMLSTLLSSSDINQISNLAFNELFYLNTRIFFASTISIIISLCLNSMLYHQIRQIKNKIWISNILSTIVINFIECIIFCVISYISKVLILNVIELIVIRYIFKITIGIIGTNIIYIANNIER